MTGLLINELDTVWQEVMIASLKHYPDSCHEGMSQQSTGRDLNLSFWNLKQVLFI